VDFAARRRNKYLKLRFIYHYPQQFLSITTSPLLTEQKKKNN